MKIEATQRFADAMNEALKADPEAVNKLFKYRVPCNDALVDHPTILVEPAEDGSCTVSALGFMNMILGELGHLPLASCWSEPNEQGESDITTFGYNLLKWVPDEKKQ